MVQISTADVRVVRASELADTAQTPGNMTRRAGVAGSNVGAKALWLGRAHIQPKGYSGAHHHGQAESAIFLLKGRLRFRYGPNLEKSVEVEEGDFIYIPAYCLHQEVNPTGAEAELIVARSYHDNIVVNVDLPDPIVKPPGL